MTPATTSSELTPLPTQLDAVRARVMFVLGFAHLLLVAGMVHRATSSTATSYELECLYAGLALFWPVFVAEALWGVYTRYPAVPRRTVLLRAVLVALMPPWRMALADPRTGLVWVPRAGWQQPGKELFKRLEQAFAGPMILFAFLILPVLTLEYVQAEQVKTNRGLSLSLDVSIAVIWVAFATEFVFKASTHPKPFRFAKERWLDVAIVVLPMLEFVLTKVVDAAPLARLLRLGRAISPEQLARMQRLYRLQGLATKAWHALLLLEGVARLFGHTPEKRLAKVEGLIAEIEGALAELRKEEASLRALVKPAESDPPAGGEAQNQPDTRFATAESGPAGAGIIASSRPSTP